MDEIVCVFNCYVICCDGCVVFFGNVEIVGYFVEVFFGYKWIDFSGGIKWVVNFDSIDVFD